MYRSLRGKGVSLIVNYQLLIINRNDISSAFRRIPSDRHLRIRRWLLYDFPHPGQVVTQYHWMTMQEFTDVVAISQMTPGPIGINAATYCGYTAVHNAGMSGMMAVLAVPWQPLLGSSFLDFDDSYQQNAVQVYENLSRSEHLHRSSSCHRWFGGSRSPAPDEWREFLHPSESMAFLHLHRPLLCYIHRREGDAHQPHPHDSLLGIRRIGAALLRRKKTSNIM